jgi:hypothetical protein
MSKQERQRTRQWAEDAAAQQEVDRELERVLNDVRMWIHEYAKSKAAEIGGDPALMRVSLAAALRDAVADLLTWQAALARSSWPLTAIAEAAGMQPTSSPARNFRGFAEMVDADTWAYRNPGETPSAVQGKRLKVTLDSYQPSEESSARPDGGR